jgi:hypothetical protein
MMTLAIKTERASTPPMALPYDVLYHDWLEAKRNKDFKEADSLRAEFERLHKLVIFAEGNMPVIGLTVRRMRPSAWESKYGNPGVAKVMREWESKVDRWQTRS